MLSAQEDDPIGPLPRGSLPGQRGKTADLAAETAAGKVRQSGIPYSFPPMNSHERRQLHLVCRSLQGVESASVGEGQDRFLVIYPEGKTNLPVTPQFKPRGLGRR